MQGNKLNINVKQTFNKKRGSIKYFDMKKSSSQAEMGTKNLASMSSQNSLSNLHQVQTISKKAIIKKPKKGKKSKFKPKNMFLNNSRSTKSFKPSGIKIVTAKGFHKDGGSLKTSESASRIKLSKNKIKSIPIKGSGTMKNMNLKKTRNLYYELKDAMTEKYSNKGSLSASKRNSLQSFQSNSARGSTFELSSYASNPKKKTIATIKNLPKSTRLADMPGKHILISF